MEQWLLIANTLAIGLSARDAADTLTRNVREVICRMLCVVIR